MTSPADVAQKPRLVTTRRSSQGGVAMSLELRPPRELLSKIGLSGKEVVKIIKARGWDIVEPHGLQQQNLYYIPGAKRGHESIQNVGFFVGEGELYAFILQQGGLRYLLPDEELSSGSDEPLATLNRVDDESDVDKQLLEDSSECRKWKRRKKLSTARSKSSDKVTDRTSHMTRRRNKNATSEDEDDEQNQIRISRQVKFEQATYAAIGQQTEFITYQNSLKARGWRAQLLQDIDVHLLRSTAAVDRRQRVQEISTDEKKSARPTEGVGPHVADAAEIRQEIDGLMNSIRASQDDLSSMIEAIISNGEQRTIPDRIDVVGRIGIPGFMSTGLGSLVLMRDIERYLLLFVAAVRRYQRSRKAIYASELENGSFLPSNRAVKRKELRALQLGIEESKRELHELAVIVAADAAKSCQDAAEDSTPEDITPGTPEKTAQTTSQGLSQSASRNTDCDADVDTDHDQPSSRQILASPRLEGGQWLV